MNEFVKMSLVVIVCLIAGFYLHKCENESPSTPKNKGWAGNWVTDTVSERDTVSYRAPVATGSKRIGYRKVILPGRHLQGETDSITNEASKDTGGINDSMLLTDEGESEESPDAGGVLLPVTQKIYESSDYKAYVSGIYPSLDSIMVYPKREVVTIRKPPKRWSIGPSMGYGITRTGLQPYIGLSISYGLITF